MSIFSMDYFYLLGLIIVQVGEKQVCLCACVCGGGGEVVIFLTEKVCVVFKFYIPLDSKSFRQFQGTSLGPWSLLWGSFKSREENNISLYTLSYMAKWQLFVRKKTYSPSQCPNSLVGHSWIAILHKSKCNN